MPEVTNNEILAERDLILSTVKTYWWKLESQKPTYFTQTGKILKMFQKFSKSSRIKTLKRMSTTGHYQFPMTQIFKSPKPYAQLCFINNYFPNRLRAWTANIDIEPMLNHYKRVTYMWAYFLKGEDETSEVMKQTARATFI